MQRRDNAPDLRDDPLGDLARLGQLRLKIGRRALLQHFQVQTQEQHGLAGLVMQFAAEPAPFFLFGLQKMPRQRAHLLLASRQIPDQTSALRRAQATLGEGVQQIQLARQPLVGRRKTELDESGQAALRKKWNGPVGLKNAAHPGIQNQLLVRTAGGDIAGPCQPLQHTGGYRRTIRERDHAAGLGAKRASQDQNEAAQQIVQTGGLRLGAQQAVEGLGFGFAHLIVSVVDGQ